MTARIKISQAGLAAGVAGKARTDGLATGALVTLEDVGGAGAGASTFHLLWSPAEDTTAEGSLAVTGDLDVWTFSPTAAVYGSYLIELREDGVPVERRVFGIRTPANQLLIPALNERSSRLAGIHNDGADQIDLSNNNADDFPLAVLNGRRYAGWWRSLYELYRVVEFGIGGIADHALALIKLVTVPAKSFLANASNATGNVSTLSGSAALQYARVNAANNALEMATLATHASTSIVYDAGTNTWQRAALTGAVTASQNGNATTLGSGVASTSIVNNAGSLERAALTGAVTSGQNSNATAFGSAAAKSVLANATNGNAVPAFLAGSAGFQYLRVNAANDGLEWATLNATSITSDVTITQATAQPIVSFAAPGGSWRVGTTYRFSAHVIYAHTAVSTTNPSFQLQNNGVVAATVTLAVPATAGTYTFLIEGSMTCRSTGAGGTLKASVYANASGPAAVGTAVPEAEGSTGTGTTALDTTSSATIRLTGHLANVVASNTLTIVNAYITPVVQ